MKCPHCNNSVSLIKLLNQSLPFAGKVMKKSLSPGYGDPIEEKLYCTSCQNRIYIDIRPTMVFLGLLLAEVGFFMFGRTILKASKYGLSAYIILSLMAAVVFSIRLKKKPGILNTVQQSYKRSINFAFAAILPLLLVVQLGFFYYNLIPSKTDLVEIRDTICRIAYHKNSLPLYIVLKNQADDNRFYFSIDENSARECQLLEKLANNMNVRLLADKSKNIFYPGDVYNIWEFASNKDVIIPYESVKKVRTSRAKADNWGFARITIFFFSGYLITLYLVRKEEDSTKNGWRKDH